MKYSGHPDIEVPEFATRLRRRYNVYIAGSPDNRAQAPSFLVLPLTDSELLPVCSWCGSARAEDYSPCTNCGGPVSVHARTLLETEHPDFDCYQRAEASANRSGYGVFYMQVLAFTLPQAIDCAAKHIEEQYGKVSQ